MSTLRYLEEEEEDHNNDEKPWGPVIWACLTVQLATLTGVFVTGMVAVISRGWTKEGKVLVWNAAHDVVIPSFGAGALLATAVFLVIPESLALIGGGHDAHEAEAHEEEEHEEGYRMIRMFRHRFLQEEENSESETTWKFGAALLGGFMFPLLLHALFPHIDEAEVASSNETSDEHEEARNVENTNGDVTTEEKDPVTDETNPIRSTKDDQDTPKEASYEQEEPFKGERKTGDVTDAETDQDSASLVKVRRWGLATSILVGDGFHNFTDGVFIGTAFLICGNEFGWTVAATSIYHELAQEIADYALLTHHCGFSMWEALALNFFSGFSVFLGGVVILATDVSAFSQGIILAISAGVYFYIGGVECVPRAQRSAKTRMQSLLFLACFVFGVVPIGLVLLNHTHCESEEEHEEEEAGHRFRR